MNIVILDKYHTNQTDLSPEEINRDVVEEGIAIYFDPISKDENEIVDAYVSVYSGNYQDLLGSIEFTLVPNNCIGRAALEKEHIITEKGIDDLFGDKIYVKKNLCYRKGDYICIISNIDIPRPELFEMKDVQKIFTVNTILMKILAVASNKVCERACGLYAQIGSKTKEDKEKLEIFEKVGFKKIYDTNMYYKSIKPSDFTGKIGKIIDSRKAK